MKTRLVSLLFLVTVAVLTMAVVVVKVSQFPNVATPAATDLFLLASTTTNKNIRYDQLKSSINATNVDGSGLANTLTKWTDTNSLSFVPNGEGLLANDGSGAFVWTTNVGAISSTIMYQTIVVQSNNFTVGKGGHLTVSNNITILTNGSLTLSNLPAPSVLVLGTNRNVTNATLSGLTLGNDNTLTATGSGGASTWIPVTTLAFSTTNVTIPLNGGTNFVVTLTNGATGYFTSSGAPSSASTNTTFTLTTIQDGTGLRVMNWDTNVFHFMGGVVPVISTNAGAEDVFTISASAKTAGKMNVVWNPDFR